MKNKIKHKKAQRREFRNLNPFERVPSASSEILGRTVSTGVVLYFELYKYTWMYKIPVLPSVHR